MLENPPAGVTFLEHRSIKSAESGWDTPENTVASYRDRALEAVVDLAMVNPTIKHGINLSVVNLQGPTGLKPTPVLNAAALGLTESQAEAITEAFEELWNEWAYSTDATSAGNCDFATAMEAALRRAFSTGELLYSINMVDGPGRRFATSIETLDTNRIARYGTCEPTPTGHRNFQGIELANGTNRVTAIYLRELQASYGAQQRNVYQGIGKRYPTQTEWGRDLLVFGIMDRLGPGVQRGVSPIISAVERAIMADQLELATVSQALEQLNVAWSIISDLPPEAGQRAIDGTTTEATYQEHLKRLGMYLAEHPLHLPKGKRASFLPPGSKMQTIQPSMSPAGMESVLYRLYLEISRGLDLSYSQLTGDFDKDSYASSRVGMIGQWEITYARRRGFVQPAYQAAYAALIEEAVARGLVKLPLRSKDFWSNRQAWTNCRWTGPTRPSADRQKDAAADDIALKNGTTSLQAIAASHGQDWREIIEQRAREKAYAERLGVPLYSDGQPVTLIPDDKED